MAQIFGNIFEDEEEKKKQSGSTQTTNQAKPSKGGVIFDDIFADSGTAKEVTKQNQQTNTTAQKEDESFLKKAGGVVKGIASKALDAGKSVTKLGLDVFRNQVQKNNEAILEHANWTNKNLGFYGGKEYKTYEEYEQDIPLVKFLNSDTGKKIVSSISESTSNVPLKIASKTKAKYEIAKDAITGKMSLKDFANIREIADREYDQAFAAFQTERNDPSNPAWQKFLYELQDTGVQSGVGILLSMGASALARNPQAGLIVSSAYYSALSADEQIKSKGKVDSLGNIAIDVVGDQMINKVLGGVLQKGSASSFKSALEGFGVEGSTEVIQSLTKYANDYANAPTDTEKNKVLAEAKQYVTSGAIVMEFSVGGTVGAGAGYIAGGSSNPSAQPNDATTKPKTTAPKSQPFVSIDNTDIDEMIKELVKLESSGDVRTDEATAARVMQLRDAVTDYARAFNDKTQYVPSEVSDAPLIDITTVTLPDGKVAMQFQANTEQNGIASVYDFNQLFSSKEQATKNAQDAIIAWAQTQEAETQEERNELAKIIDFAKNPTKMPVNEAVAAEQAAEDADIQQKGEVDSTALDTDLAKATQTAPAFTRTAEMVKVGEVIQYVPADAINANKRQTGQVVKINEKSITLRDPSGRTKRVPITARVTDDISTTISDQGRAVFDAEKAPRKKPKTQPKTQNASSNQTYTEEAKKYDSAEEFVKAQGEPVYHGTSANFEEFDISKSGDVTQSDWGKGIYFTNQKDVAKSFADDAVGELGGEARIIEAFLDIKNPAKNADLTDSDIQMAVDDMMGFQDMGDVLKKKGFDGIEYTHSDGSIEYVVFDTKQIKTKSQLIDIWNKAQEKPSTKNKKVPEIKKPATVQVVTDAINTGAPLSEQDNNDVNAQFMAFASEKPLDAIKSPEYKEMIVRGFELKNNNDPSQGFAMGERLVVNNRRINEENTKRTVEEVLAGEREMDRIDNEKMINRVRALSIVPDNVTPDTEVTIYRAASSDIGIGDHVTLDKKNAEKYITERKDAKLYELKTPLKNLVKSDGIRTEFIYAPKQITDDFVAFLETAREEIGQFKTPEAITNAEKVIEKVVDNFRKNADLLATSEGAGVRYRQVKDAVGNVRFVAKDFKLTRAKASMARQASNMKSYAKELLYSEDPIFKDAVDALEKAKTGNEADISSLNKAIEQLQVVNSKSAYPNTKNRYETSEELLKKQIGDIFEVTKPVGDLWESKGDTVFISLKKDRAGFASYMRELNFVDNAQEAGNNVYKIKLKKNAKKTIGAPSGYASAVFSEDQLGEGGQPEQEAAQVPIVLSHLDSIRPVEIPELVELARQLMGGQVPQVTKLRGGSTGGLKLGDFTPAGGGRIRLQEFLFKQENLPQAAKTLAHEMGHLIDYLSDANIQRGNLLGRLASLRDFMKSTFSFESGTGLPQTERDRLRKEARKTIAKQTKRNQKDFTEADKKAVSELYKKNLDARLKSGGYIENATIKKELSTLSRWWKPYDPAVSEAYNKYRESSAELYADAISVLLNAPRRLQDLAPTFYQKFFEGLDAKPDVREAYFEVQALLSGDRESVVQRRREGVKRMFKDGDYKAIDLHNRRVQEKENRRKQYWSHFKHTVIDKNYQIIDRVKKAKKQGKIINPDENPEYFLEERNYIGGKIKALFEREFNTIYSTLNENDITWDDFGELLFYERIAAGDRSDVANPRGITPAAAKELVENMKQEYGDARWQIMQEMAEKFRAANKKVMEEAYAAGLYKKDLYENMQANPAYVTFQVLDHLETGMTSRVYKSLGTLKDITNPADATMLKIVTTIRAAERNKTTAATVNFLKANFAEEITEAKYARDAKGRFPLPSKLPNQELVTFLEGGVVKGYYVDPYIAETINNQSVGANAPIVPIIRFMNSTLFRPLFISFNLGFQSFNFIRDFQRFYKNTPTMTFLRAIKRYGQAGRIARVRAFGLPKNASAKDIEAFNLLNKLEEEKVLSVTFNDMIRGESQEDKQIEKILADTGVKEFQPKPLTEKVPKFAKPAVKLLDRAGIFKVTSEMLGFIENLGNFIETLPKAAGVYELSDKDGNLTTEQKSFIRRKIGSPDFLAGGTYKPITNEVFLFSNAIIQGIRSDIEVATQPQTRSGFWWKTAKISFLPKLLMLAALYGAFGDEYKELMESASEYDKTNYTIIPLGRDSTGKPIYFRLPGDETSRFLGGMFWKVLNMGKNEQSVMADVMDVASYTGGQIPSISPAIGTIDTTVQFLTGQNPYDRFRARNVLSDTTFKAGGTDAVKGFLGWQFQQLGGGVFYRFYHEPTAQREEGNVEKFFNAPVIGNVLGRFVRVSDYGQLEKLKGIEKKVEQEKARETLDERKLLNKYIDQAREKNIKFSTSGIENELIKESFGGRMPSTKDELSEAKSLVKKFRLSLRRGNADPKVTALIDASSNDVKIEILKELQSEMDTNEFATLRRDLVKNNIVSGEVFNKLIRGQ